MSAHLRELAAWAVGGTLDYRRLVSTLALRLPGLLRYTLRRQLPRRWLDDSAVSDTYILAQRANRGDPVAISWVRGMAQAVAHGRYPIVVVDRHIALFTPVTAALRRAYHPVYADDLPPAVRSVVWLLGRAGERPSSACPPFPCSHSGFRMLGLPRRQ